MKETGLLKSIFTISLDFELAWGTHGAAYLMSDYHKTRQVIDRLLVLFEKYKISATWATVGHLFLDSCTPINGIKHPSIIRLNVNSTDDWFQVDPATDGRRNPEWYGGDIVEKIKNCLVAQEIGCHTFSHIDALQEDFTPEHLESELDECRRLANNYKIALQSFVFPKNIIAHLPVLQKQGYICYRGVDNNWYASLPIKLKKIAHVIDNYLAVPTRPVWPILTQGMWNIPGSYFYPHARGWARYLPVSFRVRKIKAGIKQAVKKKAVYHVWFHPFNIASKPDDLLTGLEMVFSYIDELRAENKIEVLSMGQIAQRLNETNV